MGTSDSDHCKALLQGYAALGKRMGYLGKKGGDLFVDQLDLIDYLKPYVVCLEMVPTALQVN